MSRCMDIPLAVKRLLEATLPYSTLVGLDGEDAAPDRIAPDGTVTIEAGDPGTPTIDLSPLTYNYEHVIPVTIEIGNDPVTELTGEQRVNDMLDLIASAIEADRFLGGLVDWLDATAPQIGNDYVDGAPVTCVAPITITATYSTTRPL